MSASHFCRKYALNSSKSLTLGTGVAQLRLSHLTRHSTCGFSLPRAGMQDIGEKL